MNRRIIPLAVIALVTVAFLATSFSSSHRIRHVSCREFTSAFAFHNIAVDKIGYPFPFVQRGLSAKPCPSGTDPKAPVKYDAYKPNVVGLIGDVLVWGSIAAAIIIPYNKFAGRRRG